AIPFALLAAYRRDTTVDKVTTGASFGLLSIPDFVLAVVLVYFLAVRYRVFPASGYVHLSNSVGQNLRSVILPSLALALGLARVYLVVQGVVLVIAAGYVLANFAVDLLYTVLDPRLRHARAVA